MNKRRRPKLGIILMAGFFLYFVYILINQQAILNQCKRDLNNMEKKIEEQIELNEKLERQKEILNSDEYIEKVAREKLGLVKKGEKVFIDVNK